MFPDRGIDFIIDKKLLEEVKPVHLDFIETQQGSGFKITSSLAPGAGCGSGCSC